MPPLLEWAGARWAAGWRSWRAGGEGHPRTQHRRVRGSGIEIPMKGSSSPPGDTAPAKGGGTTTKSSPGAGPPRSQLSPVPRCAFVSPVPSLPRSIPIRALCRCVSVVNVPCHRPNAKGERPVALPLMVLCGCALTRRSSRRGRAPPAPSANSGRGGRRRSARLPDRRRGALPACRHPSRTGSACGSGSRSAG